MPQKYDESAQAALLTVVDRVFELSERYKDDEEAVEALAKLNPSNPKESMASLADSVVLGRALHTLDDAFDLTRLRSLDGLDGPARWRAKKSNITAIHHGLFDYIQHYFPDFEPQAKVVDIEAIKRSPEDAGMAQLLGLILVTAFVGSPNNKKFVEILMARPDGVSVAEHEGILVQVMNIIKAIKEECAKLREAEADGQAELDLRDPALAIEEEHAILRSELDVSRKQNSDLVTRLEYLQASHDELLSEHKKYEDELEHLRRAEKNDEYNTGHYKARIGEMEDLIASQEVEIGTLGDQLARAKAEVRDLSRKAAKVQDLEDQVTELRHMNSELSKKSNVSERYRQKLASMQNVVTENQNLLYEKASLQKEYEECMGRLREMEENVKKFRARDQATAKAVTESGRENKELRVDIVKLEQEIATLKGHREHDERIIYELQDQIRTASGNPNSPGFITPGADATTFSLDQELSGAESGQTSARLEVSRLRAEISVLKSTTVSAEEAVRLRNERDEEKANAEELRRERDELAEKLGGQQTAFDDLASNPALKQFFDRAVQESLKKGNEANDFYKTHAFAEITTRLHASLVDLGQEKTTVESLRAQLAEAKKELAETKRELEENLEGQSDNDGDMAEKLRKRDEKARMLRERLKQRQEQLEKSEQEKYELQRKLKSLESGGASAAQKAANDQFAKNLQRENTLIATAWYDLTGRLQSNHVVLQRRNDAPKSWINKQRQMVNAATPRR